MGKRIVTLRRSIFFLMNPATPSHTLMTSESGRTWYWHVNILLMIPCVQLLVLCLATANTQHNYIYWLIKNCRHPDLGVHCLEDIYIILVSTSAWLSLSLNRVAFVLVMTLVLSVPSVCLVPIEDKYIWHFMGFMIGLLLAQVCQFYWNSLSSLLWDDDENNMAISSCGVVLIDGMVLIRLYWQWRTIYQCQWTTEENRRGCSSSWWLTMPT